MAILRASGTGNALYRDECAWVFRLSMTSIILWRQWFPGFVQQLVRFFIHAHYWNSRVIRHLIDVQDILHTGYEFGVFFWRDTPVVVSVGLEFIFLSTLRMVPLLMRVSSSTRDFFFQQFQRPPGMAVWGRAAGNLYQFCFSASICLTQGRR